MHPQDGPHVDLRIVIEDDRVRFEVILNLAFADELVPAARESLDVLHPVEHDALEASLRARLGSWSRSPRTARRARRRPGCSRCSTRTRR